MDVNTQWHGDLDSVQQSREATLRNRYNSKTFMQHCFQLKLAVNISFGEILGDLELGRLASECARHALPLSMRYVNVSALKILCVPMH